MGERGGKGNAGRRRGVVLVGALIFKPPERSCVGQDTFAPCLKCKLLEGRQGLLQTPKSIEEEPWMPRGSGSSLGGCEAGSVPASLERRQMPFPCLLDLNLRVLSEEPVWKNLFLFQERVRKIFVPIIKVEI